MSEDSSSHVEMLQLSLKERGSVGVDELERLLGRYHLCILTFRCRSGFLCPTDETTISIFRLARFTCNALILMRYPTECKAVHADSAAVVR